MNRPTLDRLKREVERRPMFQTMGKLRRAQQVFSTDVYDLRPLLAINVRS